VTPSSSGLSSVSLDKLALELRFVIASSAGVRSAAIDESPELRFVVASSAAVRSTVVNDPFAGLGFPTADGVAAGCDALGLPTSPPESVEVLSICDVTRPSEPEVFAVSWAWGADDSPSLALALTALIPLPLDSPGEPEASDLAEESRDAIAMAEVPSNWVLPAASGYTTPGAPNMTLRSLRSSKHSNSKEVGKRRHQVILAREFMDDVSWQFKTSQAPDS
jgi:hypothetical protein